MLQSLFSLCQFWLTKWRFFIHSTTRKLHLTYTRGLIWFLNCAGLSQLAWSAVNVKILANHILPRFLHKVPWSVNSFTQYHTEAYWFYTDVGWLMEIDVCSKMSVKALTNIANQGHHQPAPVCAFWAGRPWPMVRFNTKWPQRIFRKVMKINVTFCMHVLIACCRLEYILKGSFWHDKGHVISLLQGKYTNINIITNAKNKF